MALDFSGKKKAKVDYGRVEDGSYPARIVRILDLGEQYSTDFKTGEIKTYEDGNQVIQHKVWIDFEFPTEQIEIDGEQRPRWLGKEYTVSSHEKAALVGLLKAADPDGKKTLNGRNVKGLLGLPLMVTVGSTSGGKAKVGAVNRLMKGMTVDNLANPTLFFDLDEKNVETFATLPAWLQKRITDGVGFSSTPFSKALGSTVADEQEDEVEAPY
jgi:hypothetical protein